MNLQETLKHYFGYDSLRPGQQELIDEILKGKDVLGIMPTGASGIDDGRKAFAGENIAATRR